MTYLATLLSFRNSLNDDLLLPYPLSQGHGPQHHNRYVRDCQPVIHGNVTYETWTSDKTADFPVATTRVFVSKFPIAGGPLKSVYGHVTVVRNPLKTVSVLEPGGPRGCTKYRTATVEETAKPRKCLVAQNGGYFNTQIKQCHGNIVSDGNLVQNSKGIQNAQFGIKKDGTLVFGYLSEDDVLDEKNPFVQLVSGVVWLLRNGNIYINESKAAECEKTQETGTFDTFVNVVSARTAVGHDKEGWLILFHIDGQTGDRGMNLWEMATFLKSLGVVNAINLDGGGSATLVLNGSLANYPSDHCVDDPMWRCPRSVSTVLCVHEPQCDPANCSGHGQCVLGECQCTANWKGPACNLLECEPAGCGSHGMCTANGCVCDAGWMDTNCSEECPLNFYGQDCKQECQCESMCLCDPVTGSCNITYETNRTLQRVDACTTTSGEEADVYEKDASSLDCPALFSSSSSLEFTGDPSDPVFLQLDCCALEESWFITPPPCFTAGGHTPVLVEASPMENLLIEHPSMSVYAVNFPHGVKETADKSIFSGRLQAQTENTCPQKDQNARKRKSESRWASGGAVSPCMLIETPHKEMEVTDFSGFTKYRFKNLFIKPSPLPCLSWGSSDDVWIKMLNKELKYVHDKSFLYQHSKLQPKMRTILLDWLLEVCEVYTLHRETFYLAQDFFDRFMLTQENINKNRLQLIGITSLFIACKIEEIYPPKLQALAYVTDGACTEKEILDMELIVLKALNWNLCPETAISWLKLYIQMASLKEDPNILLPQFSQDTFLQVAQNEAHQKQAESPTMGRLSPVSVGGILTPPKSTEKPL
ncbi:UNVERIFIED_CONTAM: hypothetical protein FKN15_071873 [Acipenser sinensis]